MGTDKALLPHRHTSLLEYVAAQVEEATGSVELIGSPERYGAFGFRTHADAFGSCGPLAGIATTLRLRRAEWNLVVACDMPAITAEALKRLIEAASSTTDALCITPAGPDGQPEPLCAIYHASCLPILERRILEGQLKMRDAVRELGAPLVTGMDPSLFGNANTLADWERLTCPRN